MPVLNSPWMNLARYVVETIWPATSARSDQADALSEDALVCRLEAQFAELMPPRASRDEPPDFKRILDFAQKHRANALAFNKAHGQTERVSVATVRGGLELLVFPDGGMVLDLGDKRARIACGAFKAANKALDLETGDAKAVLKPVAGGSHDEIGDEVAIMKAFAKSNFVASVERSGWVRDRSKGQFRLVQELYQGDLLDRGKQVATHAGRLQVMLDAVEGLAEMHDRGFAHRDVKPENVFLTRDGRARLGDLGFATQTPAVGLDGTPAYMHPAHAYGQAWSGGCLEIEMASLKRYDTYALGAAFSAWLDYKSVSPQLDMGEKAVAYASAASELHGDDRQRFSDGVLRMHRKMKHRYRKERAKSAAKFEAHPELRIAYDMRNPTAEVVPDLGRIAERLRAALVDATPA